MQFEDWQTAPDPKVIRKEKQKARELRKSQWWKTAEPATVVITVKALRQQKN